MRRLTVLLAFTGFAVFMGASCATTPDPAPETTDQPPTQARIKRSRVAIDGHQRLAGDVIPTHYSLDVSIDPSKERFSGRVTITLDVKNATTEFRLHADGPTITRAQLELPKQMLSARWETGKHGGLAILTETPLPVGQAKLHLHYTAPLPKTPMGIYRVKSGADWYVYTQFEPLEARRAFPCFDQPEFKTPFKTTIRAPKGLLALTNGPESKRSPSGELTAFEFAATKPIPTYLVAFAVGPFDVVEAPKTAGLPRIRTITTKGKGKLASWANATAAKVLTELQKYFDDPYPYAKLDQVAVPNFNAGAMENVGLVTYRERLLLLGDGSKAPPHAKLWGTVVIAHELGHMWFGNKVTLAWWNDLWLNEAFATWIGFKITHAVSPEFEAPLVFRTTIGRTMSWDAQAASRAIRQPIAHGGDVYNAFDPITYRKGAAVLSMVEAWLGPDVFRKAIRAYVKKHAHGIAVTADLMAALKEASGKDVAGAVRMFLEQPGTPLVSAIVRCDPKGTKRPVLELKQTRYLPAGSTTAKGAPWRIPMCVRFGDKGGKDVKRHCGELTGATGEMELPVDYCPAWLHPNDEERGYYRWSLSPAGMRALVTKYRGQLTVVEKASLAGHLTALLEAQAVGVAVALDSLKALALETHHQVVESVIRPLRMFYRHVPVALRAAYANKVVKPMLGRHLKRLGFITKPNPKAAAFTDSLLRPTLSGAYFELVGSTDKKLQRTVAAAAKAGLAAMEKADIKVFTTAVPLGARAGGAAYLAVLKGLLGKAPTPAHRVALVRGMGMSDDPATVTAGLDTLLDGTLRAQDLREIRRFSSEEPAAMAAAWSWLTSHYDAVAALTGPQSARYLVWFGASGCSKGERDVVSAYFSAPARAAVGGKRMTQVVLEKIERCMRMRASVQPALRAYLGTKK